MLFLIWSLFFRPKLIVCSLFFRTVGNQFYSGGKWVEIIWHGLRRGPFSIQAGFYRSTVFLKADDICSTYVPRSKEVFLISKNQKITLVFLSFHVEKCSLIFINRLVCVPNFFRNLSSGAYKGVPNFPY